MTCAEIERLLRDHPRRQLPDAAAAHLRGCAACRTLYRELRALDDLMAGQPEADVPPFLAARVLAEARSPRRPVPDLRPLWVPVAAAAAGVTLAWFTAVKPALDPGRIARADAPMPPITVAGAPAPAAVAPAAVTGTRIYPVWPADRDVVAGGELSITASLYPALSGAGRVRIAIDDQDLTGDSEITADFLSLVPQDLAPGKHTVTVSYAQANGGRQSVTWCFYLLEGAS